MLKSFAVNVSVFLVLFNISVFMTQAKSFMPGQIDGWVLQETRQIETSDDLYDYIDGGAELYLSYGFIRASGYRYVKENQPDITAEIFEMKNPADAFGVYSQTRDRDEYDFGQGSYYVSGALFFWKGKYWINIITSETTTESEDCIKKIAKYIDNTITETGELPVVLSFLPKDGLVKGGLLYFHHYIWLNAYYFISTENVLDIDSTVQAVIAKYGPPENRLYLLIVKYPGNSEAENAFKKFSAALFPEGLKEGACKNKYGKWFTAEKHNSYIIAVFNGNSREETLKLMSEANKNF
jgi:hypothetical protein